MKTINLENYKLNEDEHLDENHLPVCNKCGMKRYIINPFNNQIQICLCKCQKANFDEQQARFESQQLSIKIEKTRFLSLLGKRYQNVNFDNSELDSQNIEIYSKVKDYAEHYEEMLNKGLGFYIYGKNGVGKTHLLACLCNYLIEHAQACCFTNFLNISENLKEAYISKQEESGVIEKYSRVNFLIIDDLGKESFKKIKSDTENLWLEEKIFEILNNRYNNMLPTIFSSNYSLIELSTVFGFDKGIVDRIYEFSSSIFEMKGKNRRYSVYKLENQ